MIGEHSPTRSLYPKRSFPPFWGIFLVIFTLHKSLSLRVLVVSHLRAFLIETSSIAIWCGFSLRPPGYQSEIDKGDAPVLIVKCRFQLQTHPASRQIGELSASEHMLLYSINHIRLHYSRGRNRTSQISTIYCTELN